MLGKQHYANGQKVYELIGDILTYFYRNGKIKAEGLFVDNLMEGEWKFYKQTGRLWQVGNYTNGKKNGSFIKYDIYDNIVYEEEFLNGLIAKLRVGGM